MDQLGDRYRILSLLGAGGDAGRRSARGRAMVEEALTGFRALEMVLHAKLAEDFLRDHV